MGWPPVKSWRRKELHQQHPARGRIRNDRIQANENQSRGPNSLYVKVNMEGVAIGRKINLRLFNSYQTLTSSLISMFAKCKWMVLHFFFLLSLLWDVCSGFDFWFGLYMLYLNRPKIWGSWRKLHAHLSKRTRGMAASRTCSMAVCAYFIYTLITYFHWLLYATETLRTIHSLEKKLKKRETLGILLLLLVRYLKKNIFLICRSFIGTVRRLVILRNGSETIWHRF